MAKTEKELQELKAEDLDREFKALSEEDLEQVAGGVGGLHPSNFIGVQNLRATTVTIPSGSHLSN